MGDTIGTLTRARRRPITGNAIVDADLYTGLNKNNPYGVGDPQSYGQLVKQVGWSRGQENNLRDIVANFRSRLGGGVGGAPGGSPFSPLIGGGNTAPPPAGSVNDQFSLLSVSKDPSGQFDSINRSLLGKVAGFKPNYGQVRDTSSDALTSLNNAQGDIDANRADTNTLIDKFRTLSPEFDRQTLTQTNALDRVYGGGLKDELAANTERARVAETTAAQRAMRQAMFQNRLGSAGGAGSSYAQAQLNDAMGRIGTEVAARDADRRRQDTAALLAAQERNLGRTQELNEKNLMRNEIPINARSRILDQEVNLAMRRLTGAGQAATIDQLTDELSTVGRQLGLTGQALQNYLATNFFGVNKEGQDYPLYITGGGGGGRVNPYFSNGGNGGGDFGVDGGYMGGPRGRPDPTASWVDKLRKSQGWTQDADGNYTVNTRPPRIQDFTYDLPNDFDDYGNPNSPVYYKDYNQYQPGEIEFLQDYYENPELYV